MTTGPDEPILHCPKCLGTVGLSSHFCAACGMPISSHSTIGPLEQVWSFGWLINRLLERRPSALAVLGTWLISFPFLFSVLMYLTALRFDIGDNGVLYTLIAAVPMTVLAVCYGMLVIRVTIAFYRVPPSPTTEAEGSEQV